MTTITGERYTLYHGDCLEVMPALAGVDVVITDPLFAVFDSHVTGLAQAYQIDEGIGFFGGIKQSKRFDMMHRNRATNNFTARLTSAVVTFDRSGARFEPPFTAIRSNSANPKRGVLARHGFRHITSVALLGAKPKAGSGFVLSGNPGFYFKLFAALCALVHFTLHAVHRPGLFACKGICRHATGIPFVADLMLVGHLANGQVPFATTYKTAKTRLVYPIGLDPKGFTADLANFSYHNPIIPQSMNYRTTGVTPTARERASAQMSLLDWQA